MRVPERSAVALLWTLLALSGGRLTAADLPRPIDAAERDCEARRITALIRRTRAVDATSGGPAQLPATILFAPATGADLDGTLVSNQWRRDRPDLQIGGAPATPPEAQLAFTLTALRSTLLNPTRPLLFQVGALREPTSSNLVPPHDERALRLEINPTLQPAATSGLLAINGLEASAASAVSSDGKPGRGLQVDGITTACSDRYVGADYDFMAAVAQRVLRPRPWNGDAQNPYFYDTVGGILRDTAADAFLVVARALDPRDGSEHGWLVARLTVGRSFTGAPLAGRVEVETACAPQQALPCTSGHWELFVVPPADPAATATVERYWSPSAPGARRVGFGAADPQTADVDWFRLLAGTSWGLGFVRGYSLSPRGAPTDYSQLPAYFAEVGAAGRGAVLWNGAWRDDAVAGSDSGQVPAAAALVLANAAPYGYTPLVVFGWRSGTTLLVRTPDNAINDWTNPRARQLFRAMVEAYAAERPPYVFLGNENDAYFEQDPSGYASWIAVYDELYDAIKAVSPGTLVGPVFNYEHLAGRGALNGWTTPLWGALEAHDLARIDVVALTVYPWLQYATANQVPADYLAPLLSRLGGKPIVLTETGWPAADPIGLDPPWTSSPASQVDFVGRLGALLAGHDVRAACWLFLYQPVDTGAEATRLFASIALRDDAGVARPALTPWLAFAAAP